MSIALLDQTENVFRIWSPVVAIYGCRGKLTGVSRACTKWSFPLYIFPAPRYTWTSHCWSWSLCAHSEIEQSGCWPAQINLDAFSVHLAFSPFWDLHHIANFRDHMKMMAVCFFFSACLLASWSSWILQKVKGGKQPFSLHLPQTINDFVSLNHIWA